jgi:hypothetical protein
MRPRNEQSFILFSKAGSNAVSAAILVESGVTHHIFLVFGGFVIDGCPRRSLATFIRPEKYRLSVAIRRGPRGPV